MDNFLYQFKSNAYIKYGVLVIFIILSYLFSSGSYLTSIIAIVGILLGRLSNTNALDDFND